MIHDPGALAGRSIQHKRVFPVVAWQDPHFTGDIPAHKWGVSGNPNQMYRNGAKTQMKTIAADYVPPEASRWAHTHQPGGLPRGTAGVGRGRWSAGGAAAAIVVMSCPQQGAARSLN